MVVGDQGSLDGGADLPVVPDAGVEGEEPLDDAGPESCGDAAAVAFEAGLMPATGGGTAAGAGQRSLPALSQAM